MPEMSLIPPPNPWMGRGGGGPRPSARVYFVHKLWLNREEKKGGKTREKISPRVPWVWRDAKPWGWLTNGKGRKGGKGEQNDDEASQMKAAQGLGKNLHR